VELDKITLVRWADEAIEQSFTKKNTRSRFRTTKMWPLNPKVMDNKTRPSKVYIVVNLNNARSEKEYTIENEVKNNPYWGNKYVVAEFLHMIETYQHPTSKDPPIYKPENDQRYYVNMPQSPTLIKQQLININVVNLDEGNHAMDIQELLQEIQLVPNLT